MMECTNGAMMSETLKGFRKRFEADPKNILALNACLKYDPLELCTRRDVVETTSHVYTHKVDCEIKPVTTQKSTGRCWLFAALNAMRIPFAKQHQIEEFEFSQTYLFFWDKIERSNYFLHSVVEILQGGNPISGRLMSFLLQDPISDGGQWQMIVNLVTRYGVVPKKCFPETFCSENSFRLNRILKSKSREYVKELDLLIQKKSTNEILEEKIQSCMEELYRVISICLGIPPETFTWEYYNKSKAYCSVGPITPLKFYEEYVKPYYDVENQMCLVSDPRPENPFGKTYTVAFLGNMVGAPRTVYVNQPVDLLLKCAVEAIKNNQPVWFGCDVARHLAGKLGIHDIQIHNYNLMFGVDMSKTLTKADRLSYGDSAMSHAMVFTAVSLDDKGDPTKWRVENSWGDDKGEKGYITMTTEWFKEFGFEIVVDRQFVPKEIMDALKIEPKVLPAWDPMGSLAL